MATRALAVAGAVLGLGGAPARAETFPAWPDDLFTLTLPDDLFVPTGEMRFEKATRVLAEASGGISGIGEELFQIAAFPFTDTATFATAALGLGALVLVDKPATAFVQDNIIKPVAPFDLPRPFPMIPFGTDGDQYALGFIAGNYAYGLAANDERAQVAAVLAAKALAYSYLTSHVVLKAMFGRNRPVSDLSGHKGPTGPFTTSPFDFFQGTGLHLNSVKAGTGMPSYHFTLFFSQARVYSAVYDNSWIPYLGAAALILSAAEGHNHWVSDMAAGALIGTAIGNMVVSNYEKRRTGQGAGMLMPVVSSNSAGLMYSLSF
ncbi:MAG: phosphatase PAP2 family protein [Alphaproteobacteria bacterium]|nr:MAG: phosphatase PAP2 family protein [Alphaproteobacteria bacterium]